MVSEEWNILCITSAVSVITVFIFIFYFFTRGFLLEQYPMFVFFILLYIQDRGESRLFGLVWDSKEKPVVEGFADRSIATLRSKPDRDALPFGIVVTTSNLGTNPTDRPQYHLTVTTGSSLMLSLLKSISNQCAAMFAFYNHDMYFKFFLKPKL